MEEMTRMMNMIWPFGTSGGTLAGGLQSSSMSTLSSGSYSTGSSAEREAQLSEVEFTVVPPSSDTIPSSSSSSSSSFPLSSTSSHLDTLSSSSSSATLSKSKVSNEMGSPAYTNGAVKVSFSTLFPFESPPPKVSAPSLEKATNPIEIKSNSLVPDGEPTPFSISPTSSQVLQTMIEMNSSLEQHLENGLQVDEESDTLPEEEEYAHDYRGGFWDNRDQVITVFINSTNSEKIDRALVPAIQKGYQAHAEKFFTKASQGSQPVVLTTLPMMKALEVIATPPFRCQISKFPSELGSLITLEKLAIQNHAIATITPHIEKLQLLTSLSLINNKISQIPIEICKLS